MNEFEEEENEKYYFFGDRKICKTIVLQLKD